MEVSDVDKLQKINMKTNDLPNNIGLNQNNEVLDPSVIVKTEALDDGVDNVPMDQLAEIKVEVVESPNIPDRNKTPLKSLSENQTSEYFVNIKQEANDDAEYPIKTEPLSDECYVSGVKSEVNTDNLNNPCCSKQSQKLDLKKSKDIGNKEIKKKHQCPVCQKNFLSQQSRKTHLSSHFDKKMVSCSYCGIHLISVKEFLNHRISHRPKRKKNNAKNKNIFEIHAAEKPFACNTCNKSFSLKQSLRKHYRCHSGEKPFKCEICLKAFSQNYSLKRHLQGHEKKSEKLKTDLTNKILSCDICLKVFSHTYKLTRHKLCHKKKPEQDSKPFMCEICSNRYASKHSLDNHLKAHSGERPFPCDFCDKRFYRKKLLKDHLLIHSGNRPFECKLCTKSFTQRSKLNTHMKMHKEDKPFKCDICFKGFVANCRLTKHMLIHRDTKRFHCIYCPKQFIEKRNLDAHILLHDGKKPFQCEICSKAFTWKHNLNHHIKIHSDESFQCDICKEHFPRYHILKNHIRTHTGL